MKIVLEERMGCQVTLKEVVPADTFTSMRQDEIHAYPEVWSVTDGLEDELKDPMIASVSRLGIRGRIGIYVPDYAVEANSELSNWRAFQIPENTKVFTPKYAGESYNGTTGAKIKEAYRKVSQSANFSSPEAEELLSLIEDLLPVASSTSGNPSTRGIIYSPSAAAGWGTREKDYVSQLGLHMEVIEVEEPAEDTLISIIQANYSAKVPFVSYFWTPHQMHDPRSGIRLKRLQMVDADDHCSSDPERPACYYAEDPLVSIVSQTLKQSSPVAYEFLAAFHYSSNDDQNTMLADIAYDHLTEEEAACKWINDNLDHVDSLLPKPMTQLYVQYGSTSANIVIAFAAIFILLTLVILVIINLKRRDVVIKAASLVFCNVILIGSILAYISVFMFIGMPTKIKCVLQPLLICSGYVLMYCSLVLKNYRIWRIFSNPFSTAKSSISTMQLSLAESGFLALEFLLLAIWFVIEAPSPTSVILGDSQIHYTCGNENNQLQNAISWILFAMNAFLVLSGVVLGFLTRKVFSEFNESKFIGFAIYNVVIIGAVVIPLITIPGVASDEAQFAILALGIILSTGFTVLTLFLPKVIYIFFPQYGPSHSRNSMANPRSVGAGSSITKAHEAEVVMKEVATH